MLRHEILSSFLCLIGNGYGQSSLWTCAVASRADGTDAAPALPTKAKDVPREMEAASRSSSSPYYVAESVVGVGSGSAAVSVECDDTPAIVDAGYMDTASVRFDDTKPSYQLDMSADSEANSIRLQSVRRANPLFAGAQ